MFAYGSAYGKLGRGETVVHWVQDERLADYGSPAIAPDHQQRR